MKISLKSHSNILVTCLCLMMTACSHLEKAAPRQDLTTQPDRRQLFALKIIKPQAPGTGLGTAALPSGFTFPRDAEWDFPASGPRKRGDTVFGIDISHHDEAPIRFGELSSKQVNFVYIKATQGTGFKDGKFPFFWAEAAKAGKTTSLYRGGYHFLSAAEDGAVQAKGFVDYLKVHGGLESGTLPPCVDIEWDIKTKNGPDQWRTKTPAQIVTSLKNFVETFKRLTKKTPMIYTARSWWLDRGIAESKFTEFSECPLWIADYAKRSRDIEMPVSIGGQRFTLWQFSETAQLPKETHRGEVDANVFYGSINAFKTQFNLR